MGREAEGFAMAGSFRTRVDSAARWALIVAAVGGAGTVQRTSMIFNHGANGYNLVAVKF